MSLKIDRPELVRTDGQMHANLITFCQHTYAGRLELCTRDVVVTRVRRIEARIDVSQQGVLAVRDFVFVHPPMFLLEMPPIQSVVVFYKRVCREAGAKYRRDIVLGPTHDVD